AEHPRVSARELAYIRSDDAGGPARAPVRVRWRKLLRHRQTWAFVVGKFLTDPVWWFLLFWLPKYLHHRFGLDLMALGPPLVVVYVMADGGSVAGGWLAGWMMRRGWSLNAARKGAMLVCALAVTPVVLTPLVHHLWPAVGLIGLAAAAHQGWSAN
ncbi:major facilitator superfamily MFS_1, partial [mine drainage metagenome]